jgi:hypothetical protein
MLVPSPGATAAQRQQQHFPSHIQQPSILRTTIHFAFLQLHIVRVVSWFHLAWEWAVISQLPTGTLSRASCTSLQFALEPAIGWHDPWADWYCSGIPQHATGRDGPRTCGVVGYFPGAEIPPPQINFRLNDRIEFDRPGKYKISVTCRTEFRKPQEVLDDPYGDRKSAVDITLVTEAVEVDVLPEAANVASFASDAIILLQSHFRDDDPWSFSPDSTPFPEWTQYSHSEVVVPLLTQFYEQNSNVARRGLIASPHRKLVAQSMEKELVDP